MSEAALRRPIRSQGYPNPHQTSKALALGGFRGGERTFAWQTLAFLEAWLVPRGSLFEPIASGGSQSVECSTFGVLGGGVSPPRGMCL